MSTALSSGCAGFQGSSRCRYWFMLLKFPWLRIREPTLPSNMMNSWSPGRSGIQGTHIASWDEPYPGKQMVNPIILCRQCGGWAGTWNTTSDQDMEEGGLCSGSWVYKNHLVTYHRAHLNHGQRINRSKSRIRKKETNIREMSTKKREMGLEGRKLG